MHRVTIAALHRSAFATAVVAAAFVVIMVATLFYHRATATTNDPWKSPQLLELKERLRATPADTALKEQIRALDLQFRRDYRRRLRLAESSGWLLVAGALVTIVSLQTVAKTRQQPPQPRSDPEAGRRAVQVAAWSRRAVALAGGLCLGAVAATALVVRSWLDEKPRAATPSAAPETPPSAEEFARNWPRFRGATGGGVGVGDKAPLRWSAQTGAGLAWKAKVPMPGFNSPIVWGERVFVAGATDAAREVYCFDARDGKPVWQRQFAAPPRPGAKAAKANEMTGFAPATMATDGHRIYAIFAHGDLTALKLDGTIAWTKNLGPADNPYGHASSLAVWQGRVLVQFDQDRKGSSKLLALEGATGRIVWEKPRDVGSSWATPTVIEAAGKTQVITLAEPFVIAYAFGDGAELWRAEAAHGEVVPSPIFAGGFVLAVHPSTELAALRPDGTGDVTATHVAWKAEDNIPDVTTPASDGEWVFTAASGGMLTCFNLKDGKKVWEQDLKLEVQASPLIIGKRLYVACADGTTVVAEVGPSYRELARNDLGEKILASPAVADGRLFIRGVENLFCLTATESQP